MSTELERVRREIREKNLTQWREGFYTVSTAIDEAMRQYERRLRADGAIGKSPVASKLDF